MIQSTLSLVFGGLLLGSDGLVLSQGDPVYPKPIAAVFVLVGIALIMYNNYLFMLL